MKITQIVCDLCEDGAEATQALKFFELGKPVTRGAPAADRAYDLCNGCYREIALFMDTLRRQVGQ